MPLVYACPTCQKDMVLAPVHRGREVPCPHCGGSTEVPTHLDFERASAAAESDAAAGRRLLGWAVVSLMVPVLAPAACFVWWAASGRLHRAEEDEREPDPLLRLARGVAVAAFSLGVLLILAFLAKAFSI